MYRLLAFWAALRVRIGCLWIGLYGCYLEQDWRRSFGLYVSVGDDMGPRRDGGRAGRSC